MKIVFLEPLGIPNETLKQMAVEVVGDRAEIVCYDNRVEDAETLIDSIPTLHPAVCPAATTQALTQHYQTSLRRHSCRSLMELTMSIHQKRRKAEAQNRRLGMVDERFMKQAEQLLFGELSAALDIPYEDVQPHIAGRRAGYSL